MGRYTLIVSMAGDGVVVSAGPIHPEERVEPGEVAAPWNECTIPDCRHDPCPAKLRAWVRYGQRYICREEGCDHRDCPAKRRADEDGQTFGVEYDGPALPQHVVTRDGEPLGPTMRAVRGMDGEWRLAPPDPDFDPVFGEATYLFNAEQRRSMELYLVNLRSIAEPLHIGCCDHRQIGRFC